MRSRFVCNIMILFFGTNAFTQPLTITDGSLQVWDFADGISFFDMASAGLGASSASVDTGSGFDTAASLMISASSVLQQFDVAGQAWGNGAWSMAVSFDLADSSGNGWFIESSGSLFDIIKLVPSLNSNVPGLLTQQDGKLVARAGSYILTVDNPLWQDLFDADSIMNSTWTGQSGDYSLVLRAVPASDVLYEIRKIFPDDGFAGGLFGFNIDIDAGIVAVASGSGYLFDASTGTQLSTLVPIDAAELTTAIAIDNGLVVIAGNDADNPFFGAAYLFDATTGSQLFKLLPADNSEFAQFGRSIALDGGVVVVGAPSNGSRPGAAYLFDAATGLQLAKLMPNDTMPADRFGDSVAISNGVVAVGASNDDENGSGSGSAYLFDLATGTQFAKLLPADGAAGDQFGFCIAIDDGVVAVGAPGDDDNGSGSGSAYLFDATTGTQLAKLLPTIGAALDFFGASIAIDDGVVAVGTFANSGFYFGSAYLFEVGTGTQLAKLRPSDGGAFDGFGVSIAIDNGLIASGSFSDDENGPYSGSAYIFAVPSSCSPDLTGDGLLNFFDLAAYLILFNAGDAAADLAAPFGTLNFFDLAQYLISYNTGCARTQK